MLFLGVDVGGNSIKAGLVTKKGVLKKYFSIGSSKLKTKKEFLKGITEVIGKFDNFESAGICVPGTVSKGVVTFTPNIPLTGCNLRKELRFPKASFANDADTFALAVHRFGEGKGHKNIIGLTLGTGLGSGIILDGKLFSNNGAPELGHTTIKFDSQKHSKCGNNGCLESFIGREGIGDMKSLGTSARRGEKKSMLRINEFGMYLGVGIRNFVNTFRPDIVVLGGNVCHEYPLFRKSMEDEAKKALFSVKVVPTKLEHAGIIGAASIAFYK